jgi:hypothetical protein
MLPEKTRTANYPDLIFSTGSSVCPRAFFAFCIMSASFLSPAVLGRILYSVLAETAERIETHSAALLFAAKSCAAVQVGTCTVQKDSLISKLEKQTDVTE